MIIFAELLLELMFGVSRLFGTTASFTEGCIVVVVGCSALE